MVLVRKSLIFLLIAFCLMKDEIFMVADPHNIEKIGKFGQLIKNINEKFIDVLFIVDIQAGNVEHDANYEAALDSLEFTVAYIFKSLISTGQDKFIRFGLIQDSLDIKQVQMQLTHIANYSTFIATFSKISNQTMASKRKNANITSALHKALESFNTLDINKVVIIFSDRSEWNDSFIYQTADKLKERDIKVILFGGNHEIKIADLDPRVTLAPNIYLFTDFDNLYKSYMTIFKNDSDRLSINSTRPG